MGVTLSRIKEVFCSYMGYKYDYSSFKSGSTITNYHVDGQYVAALICVEGIDNEES